MKEILPIVWCALIEALKIVAIITIGVTCVFFFYIRNTRINRIYYRKNITQY